MENQGRGHVVWIDNLFTSGRLLKTLRELEIGSAGTVRTTKTQREEIEEQTQTKLQKKVPKISLQVKRIEASINQLRTSK
jgi:hypothetical protein